MERHKCKLCSRTFANGRALGGHMKAHLATLPLPPKPQPFIDPSESPSLSYESESEQEEEEQQQQQVLAHHIESDEKSLIYGLRENPKKSFRFSDPGFSFSATTNNNNGFVVVQDRESETESKNPTRQRSKRTRKSRLLGPQNQSLEPKKIKLSFMESPLPTTTTTELVEPLSSVSDFSPEEDVAMCLMMLSRDMWKSSNVIKGDQEKEEQGSKEIKLKRVRGKHHHHHHQCEKCEKKFRSSRALGSHRSICCRDESGGRGEEGSSSDKIFECPFCFKVFGSGQALGGHKRSHLMQSSSSNANKKERFIDLNLPAPVEEEEEDDLSIVSDVSDV